MGNPRKPTALKVLEGTDRKDRRVDEPEYEPTTGAQPPYPLVGPIAVAEWERVVPLLESQRVLTETDLMLLVALCNLWDQVQSAWEARKSPTAAELVQLRLMCQEFGMTPASRAKAPRVPASESGDKRVGLLK